MASGSGWNLWMWLAEGVCGWNLWVWLVGMVVRCMVYRFPHITYPYILILYLLIFAFASLLFVHF